MKDYAAYLMERCFDYKVDQNTPYLMERCSDYEVDRYEGEPYNDGAVDTEGHEPGLVKVVR